MFHFQQCDFLETPSNTTEASSVPSSSILAYELNLASYVFMTIAEAILFFSLRIAEGEREGSVCLRRRRRRCRCFGRRHGLDSVRLDY